MNSSSTISSPAEAALGIHRSTTASVLASGVLSILTIHIVRSYGSASSDFGLALGSGREFLQLAIRTMTFDVPDLVATALGGAFWFMFANMLSRREAQQSVAADRRLAARSVAARWRRRKPERR